MNHDGEGITCPFPRSNWAHKPSVIHNTIRAYSLEGNGLRNLNLGILEEYRKSQQQSRTFQIMPSPAETDLERTQCFVEDSIPSLHILRMN
jgi:hypothetical protein